MRGFRILCALTAVSLLGVVLPLSAAAQPGAAPKIDLGLIWEDFTYEEGDFMEETGSQYGVYGAYTGYFGGNIMAHIYGSYVGGDLDYDGGLQVFSTGQVIPTTSETPNTIFNFRLAAGYLVALGGADLTPYAGWGYRLLENEITDEVTIKATGETGIVPCSGYNRDQSYSYVPIGATLAFNIGTWAAELVGEYDLFLSGTNDSYNDNRPPCSSNTTFEQDGGSGYRAAVSIISPPVMGNMRVTITPYVESWDVDQSNTVEQVIGNQTLVSFEPENTSRTYGVRVGGRW